MCYTTSFLLLNTIQVNSLYIELGYNEILLYRTDNTGPFEFDIEGVDCNFMAVMINHVLRIFFSIMVTTNF